MPKTKRMKRLAKAGLFAFIKIAAPPPPPKKKAATPARKLSREIKANLFYEKGDLNVIEAKQQHEHINEDPQPFDGTAKRDATDGWVEFDDNPELFAAAVCIVPTNTGQRKKLYRMMIKPSVLAAKQKRVANLLRDVHRDDAKAAKRRVRMTLYALGKY